MTCGINFQEPEGKSTRRDPLESGMIPRAVQIKNPQDRLEVVGKQINDAVGARIPAGGFSYGVCFAKTRPTRS
jgi:hypothetical protein